MRRGHAFGIKRLAARRLSGLARVDRRDTGFLLPLLCSGCAASQANEKDRRYREAGDKMLSLRTDFLRDASECRFLHR